MSTFAAIMQKQLLKLTHSDHPIKHYDDVIMSAIASQITSLATVYSTVYLDADQRKHQSSVSLAFVRGIHRGPVNSPHKWSVTRKMFHLMTSSLTQSRGHDPFSRWADILRDGNSTAFIIWIHAAWSIPEETEHSFLANHHSLELEGQRLEPDHLTLNEICII